MWGSFSEQHLNTKAVDKHERFIKLTGYVWMQMIYYHNDTI